MDKIQMAKDKAKELGATIVNGPNWTWATKIFGSIIHKSTKEMYEQINHKH